MIHAVWSVEKCKAMRERIPILSGKIFAIQRPNMSSTTPTSPYAALRRFLQQRGGSATVEAFMQEALYGTAGYYSHHIRTVGGLMADFSTSATLNSLLARSIAAWIEQAWQEMGFLPHIVEMGPGEGSLSAAVRRYLPAWKRWRTHWHLVETSPTLRRLQQKKIRGTWHTAPASALEACTGRALIFSNELLDAFPVQVLELHEGRWWEIGLSIAESGALEEIRLPRPNTAPNPPLLPTFAPGQRIEYCAQMRPWLAAWLPAWKMGKMLTIDYGGTYAEIYQRNPQGSLRGYYRQNRLTGLDLYQNMGQQDLTADVDWENFAQLGQSQGLQLLGCQPQHTFIRQRLKSPNFSPAEEQFLSPEGAGGAFFVLEQAMQVT
jgi:SAM-dependent MidA family methyltransferase